MTNNIDQEIYNVQNPAIGSAILGQFICGFYQADNKRTPFPLLFIVLPIILYEDLCAVINSTQKGKGLNKVSEKLFSARANDELFSIQRTALHMRELTLQSFNIGMAANLFSIDIDTAHVFPLTQIKRSNLSRDTNKLLSSAEKLGVWCAELNLLEICNMLKVRF